MNKEQQELLGDCYKNYLKKYEPSKTPGIVNYSDPLQYRPFTQEEFINKCKTNTEFSEEWGLKIEERDLSFEERQERCPVWTKDSYGMDGELRSPITIDWDKTPTKLITITYNDKTIESYE